MQESFSTTPVHSPLKQDPAHLDRKMQKSRALVTGCYFLVGCSAYVSGAVTGHTWKTLGAIALMPLSSPAFLLVLKRKPFHASWTTVAGLIMDTLLASWVVYWTGGQQSPCLPFYLTPVLAASFRFGPWGSLSCTILSITGYLLVCALAPAPPKSLSDAAMMVFRIVVLFAAAGFGINAMHRKLERYQKERSVRRQLEAANRDLRVAYKNLQRARDQLFHAEKLASIGRLVAGVAHEINNPISFVFGNLVHLETYVQQVKTLLAFDDKIPLAGPLKERREKAKQKVDYDYLLLDLDRVLKDIRAGAERVQKIVEALLGFSRTGRGDFQRVKIEDPLEEALYLLGTKLNPNIRIVREYGEEAVSHGDPGQLSQLFLNLFTNAADAMVQGGTLWVRSSSREEDEPGQIIVEVQDSGPGIPPEDRDRIFEPFFTTKEVGKGTGLGLSIAYGIVKRHRGDIQVRFPRGGGTLFRVSLPLYHGSGSKA